MRTKIKSEPEILKGFFLQNSKILLCWFSSYGDFSFYCAMRSNDFTDESKHIEIAKQFINNL